MKTNIGIIKRVTCIGLIFLLSINSVAAIVSDNDGSAFITKSEFDALKSSFQAQIDSYNNSLDSKINGAIASYLAGIKLATIETRIALCNGCTNIKFKTSMDDYPWQQGDLGMDIFCTVGKMGTPRTDQVLTINQLGWGEWYFKKTVAERTKFAGIAASSGLSNDTAKWEGYCSGDEYLRGTFTTLKYGGGGWSFSAPTTTTRLDEYYTYFSWQDGGSTPKVTSYSWKNADPTTTKLNLFNFNATKNSKTKIPDEAREVPGGWGGNPAGNITVDTSGVRISRENMDATDKIIVPFDNLDLPAVQTTDEIRDWNNITETDGKVKRPMKNGLDYPEYPAGRFVHPVVNTTYLDQGSYGWYETPMLVAAWGSAYDINHSSTTYKNIYYPCIGKRETITRSNQLWASNYDAILDNMKSLYGSSSILTCKSSRSTTFLENTEHLGINAGLPLLTLKAGEQTTITLPFSDTKNKQLYFADGPFGLTTASGDATNLITNTSPDIMIITPMGGLKYVEKNDQTVTVTLSCAAGEHMIFMRVGGENNNVLTSFTSYDVVKE